MAQGTIRQVKVIADTARQLREPTACSCAGRLDGRMVGSCVFARDFLTGWGRWFGLPTLGATLALHCSFLGLLEFALTLLVLALALVT